MEQNECECPCECPLEVNECTGNLTNAENRSVQNNTSEPIASFEHAVDHHHSLYTIGVTGTLLYCCFHHWNCGHVQAFLSPSLFLLSFQSLSIVLPNSFHQPSEACDSTSTFQMPIAPLLQEDMQLWRFSCCQIFPCFVSSSIIVCFKAALFKSTHCRVPGLLL